MRGLSEIAFLYTCLHTSPCCPWRHILPFNPSVSQLCQSSGSEESVPSFIFKMVTKGSSIFTPHRDEAELIVPCSNKYKTVELFSLFGSSCND